MWKIILAADATIGILSMLLAGLTDFFYWDDDWQKPLIAWMSLHGVLFVVGVVATIMYAIWHWALK